jgi:hypothetical protein
MFDPTNTVLAVSPSDEHHAGSLSFIGSQFVLRSRASTSTKRSKSHFVRSQNMLTTRCYVCERDMPDARCQSCCVPSLASQDHQILRQNAETRVVPLLRSLYKGHKNENSLFIHTPHLQYQHGWEKREKRSFRLPQGSRECVDSCQVVAIERQCSRRANSSIQG